MSHFSVCVVVPHEDFRGPLSYEKVESAVDRILAPYWESTEDPEFLDFVDKTDEAKADFESGTLRAVKLPDGRIAGEYESVVHDRFTITEDNTILLKSQKIGEPPRETDETRAMECLPEYPLSKYYPSFEEYCEKYCSYTQDSCGRWGYYCNELAKWDWFEIGGRFSGLLLTRAEATEVLPATRDDDQKPELDGYRAVNAARMKDIAWEKILELRRDNAKKTYERLEKAYRTKDKNLCQLMETIVEDGIQGWGEMRYYKGETLEEYLTRSGLTDADRCPISVYAVVERNGEWSGSGDMGWFGISSNDKPEREWHDELQTIMRDVEPDDLLVCVDCHI